MLSLCPCVRDDRAEVAQRAAELVKNPLPAMSGGADTRKFGDPVEGWLQRVVDGDECEAVWCCLRERHLYYYAKQPRKGAPRKPLGYVDLREGARLRDGEKTVAKASGRGLESFHSATPDAAAESGASFFGAFFGDGDALQFSVREGTSLLNATFVCDGAPKHRLWLAELAAAVDGRVHRSAQHGVAHRAVAPEHLWIDARGALKLHELPCAVRLAAADRTNTLCGVPEYVAPEVVLAAGHDHAVDLWALGVLVFELVSRRALFARSGDTPARLFARVVDPGKTLKSVWSATSNYAALVTGLVKPRPAERLGAKHDGFAELWDHKFFRHVDPNRDLGPDRAPWTPPRLGTAKDSPNDPLQHDDDDDDDDELPLPPLSFLPGY